MGVDGYGYGLVIGVFVVGVFLGVGVWLVVCVVELVGDECGLLLVEMVVEWFYGFVEVVVVWLVVYV